MVFARGRFGAHGSAAACAPVVWTLAAALLSCTGDDAAPPAAASDADASVEASLAPEFGQSACYACVRPACSQPIVACEADAACAQWVSCLERCPVADAGSAEQACASACSAPLDAGSDVVSRTARCLDDARDACTACGGVFGPDAASDATPESDSSSPHPILSQVCPSSTETNACWKCEDERCCDTYAACRSDPACEQFKECMQTCGDATTSCYTQCAAEHGDGFPHFRERMACVNTLCAVECGGLSDPCGLCTVRECANEQVACDVDAECLALTTCLSECTGTASCEKCKQAHPEALPLYDAFMKCLSVRCGSTCN